jgi:hypothetical protein
MSENNIDYSRVIKFSTINHARWIKVIEFRECEGKKYLLVEDADNKSVSYLIDIDLPMNHELEKLGYFDLSFNSGKLQKISRIVSLHPRPSSIS